MPVLYSMLRPLSSLLSWEHLLTILLTGLHPPTPVPERRQSRLLRFLRRTWLADQATW